MPDKSAGFYEPFRRNLNLVIGRSVEEHIAYTSLIAGASSGAVGGGYILYLAFRCDLMVQRQLLLAIRYSWSRHVCRWVAVSHNYTISLISAIGLLSCTPSGGTALL